MNQLCGHHRALIALGLIVLGALSLMSMGMLWPVFVMGPGLLMLLPAMLGGRAWAAAFSIPGMFLTGLGGLFFVQTWTGYWSSWAYAWTLLPVFVGMGFTLMALRLGDASLKWVGDWFVYGGLTAFAGFAVLFEVIIGLNGGIGVPGAAVLIVAGLFLLARDGLLDGVLGALSSPADTKRKRQAKPKRDHEHLFTGPIVYGTPVASRRLPADEVAPNDTEM